MQFVECKKNQFDTNLDWRILLKNVHTFEQNVKKVNFSYLKIDVSYSKFWSKMNLL